MEKNQENQELDKVEHLEVQAEKDEIGEEQRQLQHHERQENQQQSATGLLQRILMSRESTLGDARSRSVDSTGSNAPQLTSHEGFKTQKRPISNDIKSDAHEADCDVGKSPKKRRRSPSNDAFKLRPPSLAALGRFKTKLRAIFKGSPEEVEIIDLT